MVGRSRFLKKTRQKRCAQSTWAASRQRQCMIESGTVLWSMTMNWAWSMNMRGTLSLDGEIKILYPIGSGEWCWDYAEGQDTVCDAEENSADEENRPELGM